jgi:DNA uptake protein ComE-like DNA-binding protein
MKKTTVVLTRAAALALAAMLLAAGSVVRGQAGRSQGVIDPNLASEQELRALPHLDAARVRGILDRRPFLSMTELDAFLAGSLTAEQRAELYGKTFIHLNLNAASSEEILLIPNVGNRMLREFLEYRPYASLAVFHREIDKYVDDAELARLEQYVFVPVKLNTASDADILTIPGVGSRMLREFKEYRPYTTMEQFRREMGKYVDAKEVARLERYVTLN